MSITPEATVEDLYKVEDKAELVNGEVILMPPPVVGRAVRSERLCFHSANTRSELGAVYRRGETAEAEPALPGWTMPVDDLFV